MSALTAEARAKLQASRAASNPLPVEADAATMDSTDRSNARMRFVRRGWPKQLPCLGCGKLRGAMGPADRLHPSCVREAHPWTREHSA